MSEKSTSKSIELSASPGSAPKSKEKPTINEALNDYYKLKSNYEINYH